MARIAFLIDDLEVGGSELFLRDLALSLEKDQDVRVITLFAPGPVGEELTRSGIPVISLGLRKWNAPWKFLELISLLNDQSIQILHCERIQSSIVGVFAGRLASIQGIFMRRGSLPWWPGLITRWLDGLAMSWCDIVMTASEAIRDEYITELGLRPEKFEVIPHGLAGPFAPPRPVGEEEGEDGEGPIIGCVANFNWRKDHPTLLQAFRAVCEKIPTAKLHLVGTGPLESKLREEVAKSDIRDKVEFLGSRSDAREVMRQFDVLVLPSLAEGFGRVLLEGMAAGVPIVSTAVGGIPEVISNDLTGILVRPESSEAMAGAILHVLTEPAETRRLVTNARNDLRDRFSLESVVTRYRQIVGIDPSPEPSTPKRELQTEQVPCPLCRGSGETPITIRPDGHRVVRCSDCSLIYLNPMPTKEALAAMYTLEYFEGGGEFGWMKGYLDLGLSGLKNPNNYWRGLLRKMERHLGGKGWILDVGCSGGFLLEQAKRDGWEGHGVEVSQEMVDFARENFGNENIDQGNLESAAYEVNSFDAVLMHNLIEHVVDPLGTLKEVRRILRPGGVACLTTPNASAVGIRGGKWSGFHSHFGHVTFFTRGTLGRILEDAGLQPAEWEYQNLNLSCSAARGLKIVLEGDHTPGGVRKVLSLGRAGWSAANRALFGVVNALGFSRNLLVIARKD